MNKQSIARVYQLHKSFTQGSKKLKILNGVNIELFSGEIVALLGSSGSGKSTLLQLIGLLDSFDKGEIIINLQQTSLLSSIQRNQLRQTTLGFVYQFHHLLPEFTVLENVMMPLLIAGENSNIASTKALEILATMNMSKRSNHRPSQLSGGEQQRVAIARAMINNPQILLADEPTGNLDTKNAEIVFNEMLKMVKTHNTTALIATHDLNLAKKADRTIVLDQGIIIT